jgi:hypothetical protein
MYNSNFNISVQILGNEQTFQTKASSAILNGKKLTSKKSSQYKEQCGKRVIEKAKGQRIAR